MEAPKTIKVWSHDILIKRQKEPKYWNGQRWQTALGKYESDKLTITIKNGMKDSQEVETLLHEIFHAINYYTNVFDNQVNENERAKEEIYVDTLAAGLTLILKDNPELFDYIKAKLIKEN